MEDIHTSCPMSWRQKDILKILHGPESAEKELLYKFRPFNERFLDEAKIELPAPKAPDAIPLSERYPKVPFSFEEHKKIGKEAIDRVPFYAWIQSSLQIPSVHINNLKREMIELCQLVYSSDDCWDPSSDYRYEVELKRHETHQLIFDTVRHATNCVLQGKYSHFELDLDIIKDPLEMVLSLPLPVEQVLRRLDYIYLYLPLSEFSLHDLIEINWQLPEKLRTGTRTIARDIVMEDYRMFQRLSNRYDQDFVDHELLQRMSHQWQFLYSTAASMSSDPEMKKRLMKLVKLLHKAKDYNSMTAIKKGLESVGLTVSDCPFQENEKSALYAIKHFGELEDILRASRSYSIVFGILQVSLF